MNKYHKLFQDLISYGEVLIRDDFPTKDAFYTVKLIKLEKDVYYVKMYNGELDTLFNITKYNNKENEQ